MSACLLKVTNSVTSRFKTALHANYTTHCVRQASLAFSSQAQSQTSDIPGKCDICIIGGAAMGSSTAFWLKRQPEAKHLKVVVIERDNKYTTASTVLSNGGIRQQFSNGENVQLSIFGSEFIAKIQEYLGVEDEPPVNVQFVPGGYLFIATSAEGAEILQENHKVQRQYDSKVELITKEGVKKRYPCMNVDDIVLASLGVANEGWFDPWSLLNGFRRKATSLGAQYVTGEVVGFDKNSGSVDKNIGPTQLRIRTENGEMRNLEFSQCVIATGFESGKVAGLAGIGTGQGTLNVPVPVEPRKRYVYYIDAPELVNVPCLPCGIESNGVYFRPDERNPGKYLVGRSPEEDAEPSCENLDVDYSFFDSEVWPTLAQRVPAFGNLKVKSAWGGYYDYNTFDQNGIIGTHPIFNNFHFATGFSGHGIQQSPAVGRAMMELILKGSFQTIDLTRFGFERLIRQERVLERNIV